MLATVHLEKLAFCPALAGVRSRTVSARRVARPWAVSFKCRTSWRITTPGQGEASNSDPCPKERETQVASQTDAKCRTAQANTAPGEKTADNRPGGLTVVLLLWGQGCTGGASLDADHYTNSRFAGQGRRSKSQPVS